VTIRVSPHQQQQQEEEEEAQPEERHTGATQPPPAGGGGGGGGAGGGGQGGEGDGGVEAWIGNLVELLESELPATIIEAAAALDKPLKTARGREALMCHPEGLQRLVACLNGWLPAKGIAGQVDPNLLPVSISVASPQWRSY
jgi:hypothetical protein